MNQAAERHLTKAEGFLAKGEEFYRKAGEEIVAAQRADTTLSNREIGERFERSATWVRQIVTWVTTSQPGANAPIDWNRGSHATKKEIEEGARRLLNDAPLEQVERLVSELPRDRAAAIGAAAGNRYMQARQQHDEREARLTPAERSARDAERQEGRAAIAKAMGGWNVFGIVNSLGHATEVLREMIEEHSIKEEHINHIEKATDEWLGELRVARAMAGLDPEREPA
jgi:hypothetical protein